MDGDAVRIAIGGDAMALSTEGIDHKTRSVTRPLVPSSSRRVDTATAAIAGTISSDDTRWAPARTDIIASSPEPTFSHPS